MKAYQTNPQLNAERARQRGTDENVPQALAGYRPQIIASLGAGLQAVRNLLPDNSIQSATLRPWTIGVTVTQVLFNGFKTANSVRVAEFQVLSGREALRNAGQGVLLDAVTAYMNVHRQQCPVRGAAHQRRSAARNPGDDETASGCRRRHADGHRAGRSAAEPRDWRISTPRKSRWRSARRSIPRSSARRRLNWLPASPVDRLVADRRLPRQSKPPATSIRRCSAPATTSMSRRPRSSWRKAACCRPCRFRPAPAGSPGRIRRLSTSATDQASILGQINVPIYDGGTAASQTRQAKELASQSRLVLEQVRNQSRTAVVSAWVSNEGTKVALTAAESEVRAAEIALAGGSARGEGRATHHDRCPQRAAGSDQRAVQADSGAARPGDRILYAVERGRTARRAYPQSQHAGLFAGSSLSSGARRLARPAHAVGSMTRL